MNLVCYIFWRYLIALCDKWYEFIFLFLALLMIVVVMTDLWMNRSFESTLSMNQSIEFSHESDWFGPEVKCDPLCEFIYSDFTERVTSVSLKNWKGRLLITIELNCSFLSNTTKWLQKLWNIGSTFMSFIKLESSSINIIYFAFHQNRVIQFWKNW